MKVQQPWIHKIAWATVQVHIKNEKTHEEVVHNHGDRIHHSKEERKRCWKATEWVTKGQKAQVYCFRWRPWRTWNLFKYPTYCPSTSLENLWWRQWVQRWVQCTKSGLWKNSNLSRSLCIDKWRAVDNDTWNTQVCSSGWIILLFFKWKWWTTRHMQFDHYSVCTTIIVPQWSDQRLRQHRSWSSWGSCWSNKRYVRTLYGYLRKGNRIKSQNEISWKEASAQEVRGYYKQFAGAKHLECRSWVDNEVFDLIDMRKVKPRNYGTGRWLLTMKTDKQGNFLRAKARWVLRGFPDKQKECFRKTRISDELPNGSQSRMESFSYSSKNTLSSKDILMMWTLTL